MSLSDKEIGGYIEFEYYHKPMLYEDGIKLNSGRHCLEYLIEAYKIHSILLPYYICDSVINILKKRNVSISYYHIDSFFKPQIEEIEENQWIYLVNFYGQLDNEFIIEFYKEHRNLILDCSQSYYCSPIQDINTLYTCRKYFGVSDGGILFSKRKINREIEEDYSYDRMSFLLGRLEKTASEFYSENSNNNKRFSSENMKKMSKTTENLLHSFDYKFIEQRRNENFKIYYNEFKNINKLDIKLNTGPFMYPLYVKDGYSLKKYLISHKIYVPTLWPNVLQDLDPSYFEYNLANNLVLLPCDQRYSNEDMNTVCDLIKEFINEKI